MTTIKQIATACGVSAASVSKALNHASDISAETASRIRHTAREMGYFPNAAARALKTNRSHNIGILFQHNGVLGGLTHEFFAEVISSFEIEAEKNGYDITFISRNIGQSPMSYLEHCRYRNCDGVLIAGVDFTDPDVGELVKSDIPIVTIDHTFDYKGAVSSDNVQSMRDVVRYVYERGHRKIAFIHGEDVTVTRYRLAAFYQICDELGLVIPDEYIKEGMYHDPRKSGLATRELLTLRERPTCILYPDDFAFIGGMNEIERLGLSIPKDVSVFGYDGIYLSQVYRPKLTTLKQDTSMLGKESARLLVQAIRQPRLYVPHHINIPGTILEGDSVAKIPV